MKRLDRPRPAQAAPLSANAALGSRSAQERFRLGRALVAASAVVAALLTAWSLAAADADAAFPGANGKIACGGLRGPDADLEIFDVNPNGTGERLLTDNGYRDGSPAYSPDGKKIAFESGRNRIVGQADNTEIYVANNDGNLTGPDVRRLTFNRGQLPDGTLSGIAATDFSPSWSPDGTEIVFHSGRVTTFTDGGASPVSDFEIYKMSATTGETVTPATRLTVNRGQDAIPSWSPDGTKIAFQGFPPNNPTTLNNNLEVWTINPDGSGRTNLTNSPGTPNIPATPVNENLNGLDRDVIWSSDSQQLAFSSARATAAGNQNNDVWKMNRDGSNPVRLTINQDSPAPAPFTDYDVPLVWSPDNTRLLISSSRSTTSAEQTDFFAYTMDPNVPNSVSSTRVARIEQFQRCDWTKPQAAQVPPPPPTYPRPVTPFPGCPGATANVIRGTVGPDTINGTGAADRIFVGTGNDVVDALAGNDCIDLGPGADRGQGGIGDDLMLGGLGADRMSGSSGNDRLNGNPDNDNLNGGTGNDRVFGDAGNDVVAGAFGNDVLHGVAGNDRISGSRGRDRINGGAGRDTISAGSSGDRVAGDQGNDRVNGNSGNDSISGNSGNDRLAGGSGGDRLSGGGGNDRISARDGRRDRVACGRGRDSVAADRADRVSRDCERVTRR